jgi:hypothetical protein
MHRQSRTRFFVGLALFVLGVPAVFGGGHTWRVKEIFSNADGTIQYIEVWEAFGGATEIATANHNIMSNSHMFTIPSNVVAPTSNRSLLFATQGFADLNVVVPDYILVDNFFSIVNDAIAYTPLHTVTFSAGQLPTDGISALAANLSVVVNSPQNYAGQGGSIDVSPRPPGVPASGATPVTVGKGAGAAGTQLEVSFDTAACTGDVSHQVIYGFGSGLPATLGAPLLPGGAVCGIGGSPFDWIGVPDPSSDSTRVLWFLVQATNGSDVEGSMGRDSNDNERVGPGLNGSSGMCSVTDKDLSNSCGQ